MKRSHSHKKLNGFSLVELLVVIAIIAVLAGVAFPVITAQISKAKISEGKKVATDLVFAIEQFKEKYNYLPFPSGSEADGTISYSTDNNEFLLVLMGQDDEANPSNTKFFEYKAAKNGVNGIQFDDETPKALLDPWGEPYTIVIDYTGDREIDLSQVPELSAYQDKDGEALTIYSRDSIVASPGPDKEYNDIEDVKSW